MKKILSKIFGIIIVFVLSYFIIGIQNVVFAANVSVSGGTVSEGETITVNFTVSDNNGGFSGNVSYDSSMLEYVSNSVSGTGSYNNGSVAVVGGNSFSVTFKAKASGTANVSLQNIMLGDGSMASNAFSKITIKGTPAPEPSSPEPASTPATSNSDNGGSQEPTSNNTPAPEPASDSATATDPEREPNFKSVRESVFATKSMNVRNKWSTSGAKIGGLLKDQEVVRTGIGDNGWSRIDYNGKTAYVLTSLITTTKPEIKEEEVPVEENTEENQTEDLPAEENTQNTEEDEYAVLVSNIGTIPEVGENLNIYVFYIVVVLAVACGIYIYKK